MSENSEKIQLNDTPRGFKRYFRKPGKKLFWAWIVYQAIKGTLTTSLIWVPLIYFWWMN